MAPHTYASARRRTAVALSALFLVTATACGADDEKAATKGTDAPAGGESAEVTTTTEARTPCDAHVNSPLYYEEAEKAGVDTVSGTFEGTQSMGDVLEGRANAGAPDDDAADDHGHEAGEHDMGDMEGMDHGETGTTMSEKEHAEMLAEHGVDQSHEGAKDDTGHGGHIGPQPWEAQYDEDLCAKLDEQLAAATRIAEKYPTYGDAKKDGWQLVTPAVPGMGSHTMNFGLVDDTFNLDEPEMIMFDGNYEEAHIVGLSYYVIKPGEIEPDVGFEGPNDRYHRHLGLCIVGGKVLGAESTSEEDCKAAGGFKADGDGGWMQHTWVVKGCESPWGMFSGLNPLVDWDMIQASGSEGSEGCGKSARDLDLRTPDGRIVGDG